MVSGTARWCPQGPVSMERLHHLSWKHSKQGNCFSLFDPRDPQAAYCRAQVYSPTAQFPRCKPDNFAGLQNFRICVPLFIENWQHTNPLLFPCQRFWGVVFLCSPLSVFSPFFSSAFSVSPPHVLLPPQSGFLCLGSTPSSFLSQILHSAYLLWVIFLICRCTALFSKTSDQFLGCSEWFDNYLGVFEGGGKLMVALVLCHLTSKKFQ